MVLSNAHSTFVVFSFFAFLIGEVAKNALQSLGNICNSKSLS